MPARDAEIAVIWNSGAGGADQSGSLRQELASRPRLPLIETRSREEAAQATREAVARGAVRVVAAGGDGTVNAVAAALVAAGPSTAELAVLPLGTGNDLARSLGMPLEREAALDVCLNGAAHPMDLMQCRSGESWRTVANMATAGNTGRYTRVLTDEQKRTWGPYCYLRGAIDVLQDLQVYDMECAFDGGPPERYAALNLFVANGRTSGGGIAVAPEADLADGLLDVVLVQDGDPLELAALTAGLLLSRFLENELVVWRRCRTLRVTGARGLPFSGDGDVLGEAPAEFRVLPAALRAVRGTAPDPA